RRRVLLEPPRAGGGGRGAGVGVLRRSGAGALARPLRLLQTRRGARRGGVPAGRAARSGELSVGVVDWADWHRQYDDPASGLLQRLAAVREQIALALDRAAPG